MASAVVTAARDDFGARRLTVDSRSLRPGFAELLVALPVRLVKSDVAV